MKNSNDTIGNRTRDLPACSAMPQPTAPPRIPIMIYIALLNAGVFRVCNINMQREKEKFENQLLTSCSSFAICILQTRSNDPALTSGVLPNLTQTRVTSGVLTEV